MVSKKVPKGSKEYIQSVYLKFNCSRCSNTWSSAKGRTVFNYVATKGHRNTLTFNAVTYLQGCKRCKSRGVMTHDESENLRIAEKFAERMLEAFGHKERVTNRYMKSNKIMGDHDKSLCFACKAGKCTETTSSSAISAAYLSSYF